MKTIKSSIRFKGKAANEAFKALSGPHPEGPWDLSGIAKWIKEHGLSVRAGGRHVIDTTSFRIIQLYTVDAYCGAGGWIPFQMPDGTWFWLTEEERDVVLNQITSK